MNIEKLNRAQKIGQLIMPRIDFDIPETVQLAKRLVREFEIGGFIIFNGQRDIVADTIKELQSLSAIPLLFGCDAERGLGQIVSDATIFPFTMSLGASRNEDLVYKQAGFIAEELKDCGLNLIFAPVTDVNSNPENPIINIRSYGDDPELVSMLCRAFIKGSQESGVLACAKHFPGHGRTGVDSHIDLPVLAASLESLKSLDLIPFKSSIEAGVAVVMTAHIAFPQIGDENPVTISKGLVTNVLRNYCGFEGLVITDSLRMEGIIKIGKEDYLSREALNAGCDIILDPQDPAILLDDLIGSGCDIDDLESKVQRILSIKKNFLEKVFNSKSRVTISGSNLAEDIARESVCLVRGEPLRSKKACVYTFDVTKSDENISDIFIRHLTADIELLNAESISLSADADYTPDSIPEDTAIVCLVYTTIGAWKKQSQVPDSFKTVLYKLESMPNETVLVSFGSPYIVSEFSKFNTVICSFDFVDECQIASAQAIAGKIEAKGKLPVNIY